MDLQEHPDVGSGTDSTGAPSKLYDGRRLLRQAGYSLQGNRKTKEGESHPDRNAQFEHINAMVKRFQKRGQPVISVDTKKKELVGNLKNGGREWMPQGQPEEVRSTTSWTKLGKAIPYGVYDITSNGLGQVGIDHDTASLPRRHPPLVEENGAQALSRGNGLLITADGGGSNGSVVACGKWNCRSWANP